MPEFDLPSALKNYSSQYPEEETLVSNFEIFYKKFEADAFSRKTRTGHFTASAFLLSPSLDSVLLTHHQKLNIWVQLGGHIDENETPLTAALREAQEESGISEIEVLSKDILDIDQHLIPERGTEMTHHHLDLRFLLRSKTQEFKTSAESKELKWFPLDESKLPTAEESVLRMLRKTKNFLENAQLQHNQLFLNASVAKNTMRAEHLI